MSTRTPTFISARAGRRRHAARTAAVAAVAALAFTACGTPDDPIDAVDALVPPRPITATGSGSARDAAGAGEMTDGDAAPAADDMSMIMPWYGYEYDFADDLGALPTNDIGYVFEAGGQVDAATVAALAAKLGIDAEPVRVDELWGSWWQVGSDDGSAPALYVYEDAMLSWTYSAGWDPAADWGDCKPVADEDLIAARETEAVSGAADTPGSDVAAATIPTSDTPVSDTGDTGDAAVSHMVDDPAGSDAPAPEPAPPSDGAGTSGTDIGRPGCVPEPPAGVPDAAAAEQLARDLIAAAAGELVDVAALTADTHADDWSAHVTLTERGRFDVALRTWYVSFGGDATVQYAGGQLAGPADAGPFPLIGFDEAVERLTSNGGYGAYVDPAGPAVAADPAVAAEPAFDEPAADVALPAPADVDIAREIDGAEMERQTVTIVSVEADLWWVWDADGSVWLVPAYRFVAADGAGHTIPAVTDEYLIVDTTTVDDTSTEGGVEGSIGGGVEGSSGSTGEIPEPADVVDPTAAPTPDAGVLEQLEAMVGVSFDEFAKAAETAGWSARVTVEDGEHLEVTADYIDTRVNVETRGGTVVAITGVG